MRRVWCHWRTLSDDPVPLPHARLAAEVTARSARPSESAPTIEDSRMASVVMRVVTAATIALGAATVIATPTHAETCLNAMPSAARDVRGYTFGGKVLSITLGPVVEPGMPRLSDVTIAVSKVHANPTDRPLEDPLRDGQTIEIHSNACDGFVNLGLEVDSEVLISTQDRYSASTWNTAVWDTSGPTLHLLVLRDSRSSEVWHTSDRRLADVRTLRAALALVAPGAAAMPDTSTQSDSPSGVGLPLAMVVGVVGVALALLGMRAGKSVRVRKS
jgi:hypothetical protein